MSCHTYPNDRLLQLEGNLTKAHVESCHTYPNDRLLQQSCIKDFEEVVWQRSDVSLNPNTLISQDLEVSLIRFSQIPCFFIFKCWVFMSFVFTIILSINGLRTVKKFANDLLETLVSESCEICSRFLWLSTMQN